MLAVPVLAGETTRRVTCRSRPRAVDRREPRAGDPLPRARRWRCSKRGPSGAVRRAGRLRDLVAVSIRSRRRSTGRRHAAHRRAAAAMTPGAMPRAHLRSRHPDAAGQASAGFGRRSPRPRRAPGREPSRRRAAPPHPSHGCIRARWRVLERAGGDLLRRADQRGRHVRGRARLHPARRPAGCRRAGGAATAGRAGGYRDPQREPLPGRAHPGGADSHAGRRQPAPLRRTRARRSAADDLGSPTRQGAVSVIWLADEAARTLSFRGGSVSEIAATFPSPTVPYDSGGIGWVARHHQTLVVDDITADPRILHHEWWTRWNLRAYMAYPVVVGNQLLAILSLAHPEPIVFTDEMRDMIGMFIAQAAVAVQNARLYQEARRRRDVAESLASLARELTAPSRRDASPRSSPMAWCSCSARRRATLYRYDGTAAPHRRARQWPTPRSHAASSCSRARPGRSSGRTQDHRDAGRPPRAPRDHDPERSRAARSAIGAAPSSRCRWSGTTASSARCR